MGQNKPRAVSVPVVGCKRDGQAGPADAPRGPRTISVNLSPADARKLAYLSAGGEGVLGPRGWSCFDLYGSSGDTLLVAPQPLDAASVFASDRGSTGPAITISHTWGQGSGSSEVAEVVARVFPAYKSYATGVTEEFGLTFSVGPFPKDQLSYEAENVVKFRTPPQTEGLGTNWWLKKSDSEIQGVAILDQGTFNLRLLSVRLPANLAALAPVIIRQIGRTPFE
jgi:hypothetical protein